MADVVLGAAATLTRMISMKSGQIESAESLVQILFRNGGLLTRSAITDAPFWYTSNEPGPFYIYSHRVIGKDVADHLLDFITEQVKGSQEQAVEKIAREISNCQADAQYSRTIDTISRTAGLDSAINSTLPISGGERKDWIFSYPLANHTDRDHYWLTKSHSCFLMRGGKLADRSGVIGTKVLHVTDIIHKGASFVDSWLPALTGSELSLDRALSVFCRSEIGKSRLRSEGIAFDVLEDIDMESILSVKNAGLIETDTCSDIALFFEDRQAWMDRFIESVDHHALIEQSRGPDGNRIRAFFRNDPYSLGGAPSSRFGELSRKIQKN